MHKKLEAELVSIAHSILQMKNREDAIELRQKTQQLYEKLSVLTFIDSYIETTPNAIETKEELIAQFENKIENTDKISSSETLEIEVPKTDFIKEKGIETPVITLHKSIETPKNKITLEEEFKDTVSVDITTEIFQKAAIKEVKSETIVVDPIKKESDIKTSLNDRLMQNNIQVGLNDRIAFVKHLFNGSQEDFNRVLSQLNTFKTEKNALNFIQDMVKPDYDWSDKEEYEGRFINLIVRKFT